VAQPQCEAIWREHFEQWAPLNLAIGGDRVQDVGWRLQNGLLPDSLQPELFVLMIGTNDLGNGERWEVVAEEVALLIEQLRRVRPHAHVLLHAVLPRGGDVEPLTPRFRRTPWWNGPQNAHYEPIRRLNGRLRDTCTRHGQQMSFVDCSHVVLARGYTPADQLAAEQLPPDQHEGGGRAVAVDSMAARMYIPPHLMYDLLSAEWGPNTALPLTLTSVRHIHAHLQHAHARASLERMSLILGACLSYLVHVRRCGTGTSLLRATGCGPSACTRTWRRRSLVAAWPPPRTAHTLRAGERRQSSCGRRRVEWRVEWRQGRRLERRCRLRRALDARAAGRRLTSHGDSWPNMTLERVQIGQVRDDATCATEATRRARHDGRIDVRCPLPAACDALGTRCQREDDPSLYLFLVSEAPRQCAETLYTSD
jgi:hypothetical protein